MVFTVTLQALTKELRGHRGSRTRIAKKIGIDPAVIAGHSTRVGAAQEMVEQDIDAAKIMLAGRWSSLKMVTRYAAFWV
ncbi:MAG: tyrosine-type recombinase/integrase [Pseudomonadales bacterium]